MFEKKYDDEFTDRESVAREFGEMTGSRFDDNVLVKSDFPTDAQILYAYYDCPPYEGYAFVLFERDGKLYEANGSHCSCYGLEGQWEPEETSWAALAIRVPSFSSTPHVVVEEAKKRIASPPSVDAVGQPTESPICPRAHDDSSSLPAAAAALAPHPAQETEMTQKPDINAALENIRTRHNLCMECGYPMLDGETHAEATGHGVLCTLQPANAKQMPEIFFDHFDHANLIRVIGQ